MGSSGGRGGGGGTQVNYVRYAPYLETMHEDLLDKSLVLYNSLVYDSPYTTYAATDVDYTDGLFGAGYSIGSYPSLYDMFGKFMAGLDVEALWHQVLTAVQDNDAIDDASNAHRDLLDDQLESDVLPRFQLGMRDMNAIHSSTFLIGKALLEDGNSKQVAKYDAEVRLKMIPVASDVFAKHLAWNQSVVGNYLEVLKLAFLVETDSKDMNMQLAAKEKLWSYTIMNLHKDVVGVLNGARTTTTDTQGGGSSKVGAVLGGTLSGAAVGAQIGAAGGPIGATGGAIIGGLAGLFS
jgi:hypothetical protein